MSIRRFRAKFNFITAVIVWNVFAFLPNLLRYGFNGLIEDWKEDRQRIEDFCVAANKVIK